MGGEFLKRVKEGECDCNTMVEIAIANQPGKSTDPALPPGTSELDLLQNQPNLHETIVEAFQTITKFEIRCAQRKKH